ncbi:MAG: fused response regulator/phosphatase [Clostridiales bacterium]|nr:fused response regulator/phosphatase [Clostridiales bacterium]
MDKILIMDSSPQTLDLLSKRLNYYGYEILTSDTGVAGLNTAKFFMPDLIILETELSDMSGFEVCRKIKENDETKYILVLFMTSLETKETSSMAIEVGADDFVEKNSDSLVLISKVKSLLRVKHLVRQLSINYYELEEKNKILQHQLKMGRDVQRSLIKNFNFTKNDVTFYSIYLPALDIGGDFYDIVEIQENIFGVIVGDVSGHGISAALLTSMMSLMFKNLATNYFNPDQLLFSMNNQFCEVFKNGGNEMYSCVFYAVIDTKGSKIYYSNAGQSFPIYIDGLNLKAKDLESVGMPIGLMPDSEYEYKVLDYNKGDLILFYTDGLSDNFYKEQPDEFLVKLKELLLDYSKTESVEEMGKTILSNFCNLNATSTEKFNLDDVSIVMLRF